jgi:hypothetical protein
MHTLPYLLSIRSPKLRLFYFHIHFKNYFMFYVVYVANEYSGGYKRYWN